MLHTQWKIKNKFLQLKKTWKYILFSFRDVFASWRIFLLFDIMENWKNWEVRDQTIKYHLIAIAKNNHDDLEYKLEQIWLKVKGGIIEGMCWKSQ